MIAKEKEGAKKPKGKEKVASNGSVSKWYSEAYDNMKKKKGKK